MRTHAELLEHLRFDGECLRWIGTENGNGYGRVTWKGKRYLVHRLIWELAGLNLPDYLVLDHTCHVRDCVSFKHLQLITLQQNTRNRDEDKRQIWLVKWEEMKAYRKANYCCDKHHI